MKIQPRELVQEMQDSYLDYAMSVIVARALPDVRDGLKPVHRRILYAMWEDGLRHNAKFRKSATVVGSCLGRYHPHGDIAVYDALARMAQDFSLRYPLIEGQGNWGSIDGDSQAAMRYTEARLSSLAEEMLTDLEKGTVNWTDNYDGTKKEPQVLPSKLPQLLLNGSLGIAVGMATNIPPHNLGEVSDAILHLLWHPQAATQDLFEFIKGPDFPTGGVIYNQKAIEEAYNLGKGSVVNRAATRICETKKGNFQIIVSEIPFQVNKSFLLERIALLVKEKKLEGIRDLRDESDREGIRIVIDLKIDAQPQRVLNKLFKLTDLQRSFHLNMVALTEKGLQPQTLSLKNILEHFISHRQEVIFRRTQFDLTKAKERTHILEGLKKALDHIDAVIATIKKSRDRQEAFLNLIKKFKLTELQAEAILEMKLQTLAGMERKKIEEELKEKKKLIKELEEILCSPKKIKEIIEKETHDLKEKYGDQRRTKVFRNPVGEFKEEDLVSEEECIITLTEAGYIKRLNPKSYKLQQRGGKGVIGIVPRDQDNVFSIVSGSTHDNILFFTNLGRVFQIKAYEIQESSRQSKGVILGSLINISPNEKITSLLSLNASSKALSDYLAMCTKNGIIKKTKTGEFEKVRKSGLIAISLSKDDQLKFTKLSSGQDEIILVSKKGQSIRFREKEIRAMSRQAAGVIGFRLRKDDEVMAMEIIPAKKFFAGQKLLLISENGLGKKTPLNSFRLQRRAGQGIKAMKITKKSGEIIAARILKEGELDLVVISQNGQVIKTLLDKISTLSRMAQGVKIMKMEPGDKIASIVCL